MKDLRIEPWMIEFSKGRHTEDEWEAFYVYMEAGPTKRWFIRVGSWLCHFLGRFN